MIDLGLREFCREIQEDPSNWSKVERGVLKPPQEIDKLYKIGKALKLKKDSDNMSELIDLARIDAGRIPDDIVENPEILGLLPAFLRTVRNQKPTSEEIDNLIGLLKKGV